MNHIKRLSAPKTWNIQRKDRKFIVRPAPSGHSFELSIPLLSAVRDSLRLVHTARELKALLREKKVMVDGNACVSNHTSVGLFDLLSFPTSGQSYRITLNSAGKLEPVAINHEENEIKICKITGKQMVRKGKVQITLHDGHTFLTEDALRVGDSVVLQLPKFAVQRVLELDKGAYITLIGGKSRGAHGKLVSIEGQRVVYQHGQKMMETLKKYVMVVGEDKPLITIHNVDS